MRLVTLMMAGVAALALTGAASAEGKKAEVIHWWTSGGEAAAVRVFAEEFNAAGGEWVDAAVAAGGGDAARALGISRIVGGNPPTSMQFNFGKQFEEIVLNGYLNNLDALAAEGNWQALVPPVLWDSVVFDGHVYGVPVNIHGVGWSWWSNAALQKAGATAPTSWEDFFPTLDKLKAAGVVPIALGGQAWQESILFNWVINVQGGKEMFKAVFADHDVAVVNSPEFRAVVESFAKMKDYIDPGSPGRNWNDATAMVITGSAGVQVMGDWAKGEFIAAGQTPGKEYTCTASISGKEGYIIGGDVFVFPKVEGEAAEAQLLLAKTMIDPAVQVKFNALKGSIPVRGDVDTSNVDSCGQEGLKMVSVVENQLPNVDFTNTPDQRGSYEDAVTTFWNTPDASIDDFIAKFAEAVGSGN